MEGTLTFLIPALPLIATLLCFCPFHFAHYLGKMLSMDVADLRMKDACLLVGSLQIIGLNDSELLQTKM